MSYILITPIDKTKSRGEEKLRISCANMNTSVEVWDQGFTLTNPCGHQMSGEAQDSEQTSGNWCHCFSLEYSPRKGWGTISTGISRPDLFCAAFLMWISLQDQDQGPHPKAAQVNGKTLIVFSELWIRPQKLSHTLNGTLFEAKQAEGFIHVEVLTVQWNFPSASCALLPASSCHFCQGTRAQGEHRAQCLTPVAAACSLWKQRHFLWEIPCDQSADGPFPPRNVGENIFGSFNFSLNITTVIDHRVFVWSNLIFNSHIHSCDSTYS